MWMRIIIDEKRIRDSKIRDNSPKYVFSLDKKDTSRNGVTHINIIDFLMNKVDLMFS